MDKSEQFRSMAKSCLTIQCFINKDEVGNHIYFPNEQMYYVTGHEVVYKNGTWYGNKNVVQRGLNNKDWFWCPSVNNLMGLLKENRTELAVLADLMEKAKDNYYLRFSTLEQLLLAYMMDVKVNRRYHNGRWLKQ